MCLGDGHSCGMDARRSPQSGNRPGKVRLVPGEKWFSDSTLHFRHSFSSLARWFRRGGSFSQGRAGRVWTPAPRGGRPVRRPCGEASGTLVVPTPSCPLSPRGVTGLPFMYVKCFHFQELRKLMHPMCKKDSDLFDDVVLLSSATLLGHSSPTFEGLFLYSVADAQSKPDMSPGFDSDSGIFSLVLSGGWNAGAGASTRRPLQCGPGSHSGFPAGSLGDVPASCPPGATPEPSSWLAGRCPRVLPSRGHSGAVQPARRVVSPRPVLRGPPRAGRSGCSPTPRPSCELASSGGFLL